MNWEIELFVWNKCDFLYCGLIRLINLDFIGTRLHAGIRALQKFRRTIILGIDNRATEKSKDFNLKVLQRDDIDKLNGIINNDFRTEININETNIKKWKDQFKSS